MIYFYSGTPGSGKSLHMAKNIYNHIKKGGNVIANFEINEKAIKVPKKKKRGSFLYMSNDVFFNGTHIFYNDEYINVLPTDILYNYALNFHKRNNKNQIIEHQTMLIIDEAQILFNSRDWQSKNRREWVTFFTQHRKYGYDVYIVSQNERLLDRQIRGCFEYEVNHKKVMNYKTLGALMSLFSKGALFVAVTHWYGVKGKENNVGHNFFKGKKKYYDIYNSYKIFES